MDLMFANTSTGAKILLVLLLLLNLVLISHLLVMLMGSGSLICLVLGEYLLQTMKVLFGVCFRTRNSAYDLHLIITVLVVRT